MARRLTRTASPSAPPHADKASSTTPVPPRTLHVTLTAFKKGAVLHRVHQDKYLASQFNPGVGGNARFSPIQDDNDKPIPTLYGGATMECALMETVFHDVPYTAGFKTFDKEKLARQVHSFVRVEQQLQLVDLASVHPQAQGLSWVSRQDDSARAVVLFGDRIPDGALRPEGESRSLLEDPDAYDAVLDLADRIGVYIVPGKS